MNQVLPEVVSLKTKNKYPIANVALGNILEWYDFGLFALFSSLFSQLFFPTEDPHTAILATISIFTIGFLCRPIGALMFGYMGDKYGRAKTLRLSILMITLPTLLIGFLPTYKQLGFAAPILLTLVRICQGISIGGEYSGNIIYLAETAPSQYRASFTSIASIGANIGILLATLAGILVSQVFTDPLLHTWGWRIPYIISGLFSLIIYRYRLNISETAVFNYLKQEHLLTKNPISTVFKSNMPELTKTIGLVCMGSTFYYFCFMYIPIYLTQERAFSVQKISLLMSLMIGLMIIIVPFAGYLCDHLGRKKMLLVVASLISLMVIPGFYFLQHYHAYLVIFVILAFTLVSSLEQGATSATVVENFPPPARYTGIALGYNIGNGFLGGTVPILCEWFISVTKMPLSPAVYIAFCALTTGAVVLFFIPETQGKSLTVHETI